MVKYTKPDIICGTESWLKQDIKSSEVFPEDYTPYRKDRSTLGGGVFILVHKSLVSTAQPDLDTECELIWTQIHLERNKDLLIGCFYMPHRNDTDLTELDKSLQKINTSKKQKHTVLTGDFNCPDIDWNSGTVPPSAPDRQAQQTLVDLTSSAALTQVHHDNTREDRP
ncbi:uncharacterized protein [Littorina saxatilis]|uniref:uncharacterized protein n=1 Tax=Littorina saxatilis TaxID=31220 RepID=UPI0038B60053